MKLLKELSEWAPVLGLAGLILAMQARTDNRLDSIEADLDSIQTEVVSQGKSIAKLEGQLAGVQFMLVPEGGPVEGLRYEVQALTAAED